VMEARKAMEAPKAMETRKVMEAPKTVGARKVAEGPKAAEADERKYGESQRLHSDLHYY
jgi:hypothetical protein